MEQDFKAKYDLLMNQAARLEEGEVEKMNLLEKAVNLADLLKDIKLQIKSRKDYINAATMSKFPEKAMTAFSFLLKKYDEDADAFGFFEVYEVYWMYKWVIGDLVDFPSIPLEKIEVALKDMETRYRTIDFGMQAVYQCACGMYAAMGDPEKAEEFYEKSQKEGRDLMSDCEACSLSSEIAYLITKGEFEKAIEKSEPLLSGEKSCRTIPNQFYHRLFRPYLLTGQKEKANEVFNKIEREDSQAFLNINAECIRLKAVLGEFTFAVDIFEKNILLALNCLAKEKPFQFYMAGQVLFKKMLEKGHMTVKMNLSKQIPFYKENNEYEIMNILAWLYREVNKLASQFNRRNGNEYFSELIKKNEALVELR